MGLIQRNLKTGGNRTFSADVAGGYSTIKSSEVDADYDTVFTEFNGNIDNANVKTTAAIAYAKLNLTGSLVNSDISASAAIDHSKIAWGTLSSDITTAALQPLSVTIPKLARGAAIVQVVATVPTFTNFSTTTLTQLVTRSVTARGAGSILAGSGGLVVLTSLTTGAQTITINVKRDGATFGFAGSSSFMTQPTIGIQTFLPLPAWFDSAADSAVHTYTIDLTFTGAGVTLCSAWFYPHNITEYA